tara:strand:+ start:505 stop:765 length:261 start_codon:yes stop_codon:yes gene_type:complete
MKNETKFEEQYEDIMNRIHLAQTMADCSQTKANSLSYRMKEVFKREDSPLRKSLIVAINEDRKALYLERDQRRAVADKIREEELYA